MKQLILTILSLLTLAANAQRNVPYYEDFSSIEDFNTYTIIDGYNDGCTWELNTGASDYYTWCRYNSNNPKDEWLISPAINLEAGKTYTLSFKSFAFNPDWPERMEVCLGQGTTAECMTQVVMPEQQMSTNLNAIYTYTLTVEADGAYNIGFHACSNKDMHMLVLDKVSLTEGGNEEKDYSGSDIPSAIEKVTLREHDGVLTLSWDAPETGAHGGKLAPGLKYKVRDNHEMSPITIEATAMEIDGYNFNKQTLTYFTVTPINDEGEGASTLSNYILLGGDYYTLPVLDTFDNGPITSIYWNYIGYWHIFGYHGVVQGYEPYDGYGCLYTIPVGEGEQSLFFSGNITLGGSINPAFEFYYYNMPESKNKLEIVVSLETGEWECVKTIEMDASLPEGWTKASANLNAFMASKYLQVGIRSVAGEDCSPILIDHFELHDVLSKNLAVESLEIPSQATAGASFRTRTIVRNVGLARAEGYYVKMERDGTERKMVEGPAIEPGASAVIDIYDSALASETGTKGYATSIIWDEDENLVNNASGVEHIVIKEDATYPVPDGLTANLSGDDKVMLRWNNVMPMTSIMLTDDFEGYPAFTISELDPWSVYDADGQTTYYAASSKYPSGYPNSGDAMAWQVLNLDKLGFNSDNSFFSSKSGNQILAAFITDNPDVSADDWLFSPELSGEAHTLSFWTTSPVAEIYGCDQFEVLGSTTGRAIEDFNVTLVPSQDAPAEWTKIEVEIQQGIKYFAIRHTAGDTFLMTLDDVTYSAPAPQFIGYNVYSDGVLLNDMPLAEPQYETIKEEQETARHYYVTAVYANGESALSEPVTVDINGISNISAEKEVNRFYDLTGRRTNAKEGKTRIVIGRNKKHLIRK